MMNDDFCEAILYVLASIFIVWLFAFVVSFGYFLGKKASDGFIEHFTSYSKAKTLTNHGL
jgi:hypothetical protein